MVFECWYIGRMERWINHCLSLLILELLDIVALVKSMDGVYLKNLLFQSIQITFFYLNFRAEILMKYLSSCVWCMESLLKGVKGFS